MSSHHPCTPPRTKPPPKAPPSLRLSRAHKAHRNYDACYVLAFTREGGDTVFLVTNGKAATRLRLLFTEPLSEWGHRLRYICPFNRCSEDTRNKFFLAGLDSSRVDDNGLYGVFGPEAPAAAVVEAAATLLSN